MNAEFSEHYFYSNTNINGEFQICISVPLIALKVNKKKLKSTKNHIAMLLETLNKRCLMIK